MSMHQKVGWINTDYDGTFTNPESGLELAGLAGKGKEAEKIYLELLSDCDRIVRESKTTYQLMRDVEETYRRHLIEGAKLLRGCPASILTEVRCDPNENFFKIMEGAKDAGGLRIVSYSDETIVRNFLEQNKESIPPVNLEVVCSRAEEADGKLTGRFLSIPSKTEGYPGGDVVENSIGGIRLCNEAYKRGFEVRVIENGEKTKLLEETLTKSRMPYS